MGRRCKRRRPGQVGSGLYELERSDVNRRWDVPREFGGVRNQIVNFAHTELIYYHNMVYL